MFFEVFISVKDFGCKVIGEILFILIYTDRNQKYIILNVI